MKYPNLQSFEKPSFEADYSERLGRLRKEMAVRDLDGFLVPHSDEHQNENLPASAERLLWLTGFTGSAGLAIVTRETCNLFVDGRYTIQARQETEAHLVKVYDISEMKPEKWLSLHMTSGLRFGYHSWLHTAREIEKYVRTALALKASMVGLEQNPLDAVWHERPQDTYVKVEDHDLRFAGERSDSKILRSQRALLDAKVDATITTDPQTIAWLFNIRGRDVRYTPVANAFAIIMADERPKLFINPEKLPSSIADTLSRDVDIYDTGAFDAALFVLGRSSMRVRVDPKHIPERVRAFLSGGGAKIDFGTDILAPMRAIKNKTEIAGIKNAMKRDGVAMAKFLQWFEKEAPKGKLTEIDACKALEEFRHETKALIDLSFPTIAAYGENGAIVHYRPYTEKNAKIMPGSLFLIDSGAQYRDGTTDITRTLAVGEPTAEMKNRFTRVLKGHISLARSSFPKGTTGSELDPFARRYLWEVGLDYSHGTGHGVGSFLGVHEGYGGISKKALTPLMPGMVLSNEPGYYKKGEYGIRIENLQLVVEKQIEDEDTVLAFEPLTLAPIDLSLVEPALLSVNEVKWLNSYHTLVYETLVDELDKDGKNWLSAACAPFKN